MLKCVIVWHARQKWNWNLNGELLLQEVDLDRAFHVVLGQVVRECSFQAADDGIPQSDVS